MTGFRRSADKGGEGSSKVPVVVVDNQQGCSASCPVTVDSTKEEGFSRRSFLCMLGMAVGAIAAGDIGSQLLSCRAYAQERLTKYRWGRKRGNECLWGRNHGRQHGSTDPAMVNGYRSEKL
jgi:hypothetical protein